MIVAGSKRAKARWQLLASVLKNSKPDKENIQHSVRRFSGFNLYDVENEINEDDWFKYTLKYSNENNSSIKIRLLKSDMSPEQLIGFNNTGNVCIWPSEEVLAYYCAKNKLMFNDKNVCELGGGMTSLAGIQIAVTCDTKHTLLTDGNDSSVENTKCIVGKNSSLLRCKEIACAKLLWSENIDDFEESWLGSFDFLICADALFFEDSHQAFLCTIDSLLKRDGVCIMVAPKRLQTLDNFVCKAREKFDVEVTRNYDELIWSTNERLLKENPLYDPDIHYPLLISMKKKY